MWDTKSRFTTQTSAWYGLATVSGPGFLSKVSTSTSGFGQNDPSLRRWQSLSCLAPDGATRSFLPSPGAELKAARRETRYRHTKGDQWLQDAHDHIDSQLDLLRARDAQLSYKLSEAVGTLDQGKQAAVLVQFDKNQHCRELDEKVLKLERDLVQMRSTLGRGSNHQPRKTTPGSPSKTLPVGQDNLNKQEVDAELHRLREALKEAETRAKTQEEEQNQALQQLQISTETQKTLLSQIEEMNQRLSATISNHSEIQEQLSEANNKISQACLEKAILSTQALKLQDNIKELKAKLTEALSGKEQLIQRAQVLELNLERAQPGSEDCEIYKQMADAESCKNTSLIKEEEKVKQKCCQLSESVEVLELEKQKVQDQCWSLEAELFENKEKLHQLEEKYQEQDALRIQHIEQLKAVASHWTEKWQKVALTLQSTQEELEELKKYTNEGQSDSLLRAELDSCKQELQLEKSRNQALLHKYNDEGGAAVQTKDKGTRTDLSESSLLWEPKSDSHSSQRKSPQGCTQSSELQMLREKLSEKEKELKEKEEALKCLGRLRETEKTEAQIKVSALELKLRKKASEDSQDGEGNSSVSISDSLRTQLEESGEREKLQALKQLGTVEDEEPPVQGRKDKIVYPVNLETDQHRRMVTEQLKSLFKEREEKEVEKVDNTSSGVQTGTSSVHSWTPTSKAAVDRWGWQQSSGLMPVFEEDEEDSEEAEGPEGETHVEENLHMQGYQMSAKSAEISNLKEKNENLLQAARFEALIQDHHTAAEKAPGESSDAEVPVLSYCPEESGLQTRTPFLYPDGIFQAQLVDIGSPDEDEEERENQ